MLLAFAAVLLLAVLVSSLAKRTILSTAVLFLVAGFVLGPGGFGVVDVRADTPIVATLAELALFAVLFTDGMRVGWADLRSAWRLPGRALGWGLPLTLAITAVLAHFIAGLDWPEALLIGAILAPTDPVFAAALVGNDRVPARLRHLLNVESGVNDGLVLPFVVVLLAVAAGSGDLHLSALAAELAVGLVIGVAVPWIAIKLERMRFFAASTAYEPLNAVAIGLLVLAMGMVTHGNLFIAAFAAGITVATFGSRQRESFEQFGGTDRRAAKARRPPGLRRADIATFPRRHPVDGLGFRRPRAHRCPAGRPRSVLPRFRLGMREQAAAMWFGPKGFASVVYGLLVLQSRIPAADKAFHLIALTVVLSILAHSSTDILVARSFDESHETPAWHKARQRLRRRA